MPSRGVTLVAGLVVGTLMAVAPAFSGLALLTVLVIGAVVGGGLFALAGTESARPAPQMRLAWLVGAVLLTIVEILVLQAGDDLRWPTFSAIQDPVTTAEPVGRFAAGFLWTVAGAGLLRMGARRWNPPTRVLRGAVVAAGLLALAAASVLDGPMLRPRDAPLAQAPGIDTTAVELWPLSAWLTIAAFAALTLGVVGLHTAGRRATPPGAVPDLLGWLMAPLVGRVLGFALWLWCGWHFLAR